MRLIYRNKLIKYAGYHPVSGVDDRDGIQAWNDLLRSIIAEQKELALIDRKIAWHLSVSLLPADRRFPRFKQQPRG